MATYTSQDAITIATKLSHNPPTSPQLQAQACDFINSRIWTAFPWTWTRQTMTTITLTDGVQDYALGGSDLTNFYRFANLEIQNTSVTPTQSRFLSQKSHLSVEVVQKGGLESIRFYSWESTISKIRLDYAASVPSSTVLVLNGEFQNPPTKITDANLTTALLSPDHYFQVFVEGVIWYFYRLTDDPRSGTIQLVQGRQVYTGQLGVFMDAFTEMKKAEDFSDAEDVVYPAGGTLGVGKDYYTPRIFG